MNRAEPSRALSITVVLTGVFISALDLFIVNIAFPKLEHSFSSASLSNISWVLSAYAIMFAALLMPAGRWADQSGRKRAFLAGLALFTLASAGCAAAPSLGILVAARVLQAVGAALMMPSSLGLLLPMFPPEKRAVPIGLWSAVGGVAAAAGPPIGGLLVQLDWRWVFLVNIPIGVVSVLVGWRVLREVREETRSAPDVFGALVLAATVAVIVGAIVQGQEWGWGSARILGLIALGVLGVLFTVWRMFRHPAPVIEPGILKIRSVAFADLATLLFMGGFGAMVLASTLFLTAIWHHSILRAGMEIAPGPLMVTVVAVPGGLLAARFGARAVGLIGGIIFAAGGLWWVLTSHTDPNFVTSFLPGAIIGGIGLGLILPSLSGAATLSLPPERFATGTAMNSMCRQVGLALGIAVVAAILDGRPGVSDFHAAWLFMAGCGLVGGLVLLTIGAERPHVETRDPVAAAAN
ncbi:DHA2 family efflux MFS transporter permease subunit [Nocardia sp. NPDC020380]|uniref:DHA2 family efflux MFS transporter permease subunit n=1 Tax=Nocardia sp. NPDC020380 TaxID=3364309 RepID=UPI003792117A